MGANALCLAGYSASSNDTDSYKVVKTPSSRLQRGSVGSRPGRGHRSGTVCVFCSGSGLLRLRRLVPQKQQQKKSNKTAPLGFGTDLTVHSTTVFRVEWHTFLV